MSIHLQRAIENLNRQVLSLGGLVEDSVLHAVRAVEERDDAPAQHAFRNDDAIDAMEVEIEEECLKILALYQPVAADLRFIVAVLKINNDLERIGDTAVNIAERAVYLAAHAPLHAPFGFAEMGEKTQAMLRMSLDALVNANPDLAYAVCARDDEVDALNRDAYIAVQDAARAHPDELEALIHVLSISRHLERIADLATNIAEDVIYMARGEIVRHRLEEFAPNNDN